MSASVEAISPSGRPAAPAARGAAPCRAARRPDAGARAARRVEREAEPAAAAGAPSAVASRQRSSTSTISNPGAVPALRSEALEAAAILCLLVARRDDHHRSKLAQRHAAPSAISSLAALVVLVALVSEHADETPVARVPGGEGAVGVGDEADRVEAVAPGRVLDRAIADRRPEAGHRVPRRASWPAAVGAGDLALCQRIAPVLDAQRSSGGGVVRAADVARGEHVVGGGAHRESAAIAPSSVSARPAQRPRRPRGATPTATSDRSAGACGRRPDVQADRARVRCGRARSRRAGHPLLRSQPRSCRRPTSPRRACFGAASSAISVTARPRLASDAAASQPMNPEPTTTTARRAGEPALDLAGVVERPEHAYAGWFAPGTGRRRGSAPVASTQRSKPSSRPSAACGSLGVKPQRGRGRSARRRCPRASARLDRQLGLGVVSPRSSPFVSGGRS